MCPVLWCLNPMRATWEVSRVPFGLPHLSVSPSPPGEAPTPLSAWCPSPSAGLQVLRPPLLPTPAIKPLLWSPGNPPVWSHVSVAFTPRWFLLTLGTWLFPLVSYQRIDSSASPPHPTSHQGLPFSAFFSHKLWEICLHLELTAQPRSFF